MDDDSISSTSMEVDEGLPSGSFHSLLGSNVVPYTDNEHHEMDKAVVRTLGELGLGNLEGRESPPSVGVLALVLQQVIRGDDRLDPKYHIVVPSQLFMQYPSLAPKVADAWRTGSYRHIRELDFLQAPVLALGRISENQLSMLRRGLTSTYQGCAVDAFLEYLKQNNKVFRMPGKKKYYGKFCSIVQSSGTGKTRLMLELGARDVCVLYLNIRSPNDTQGYPERDNIPANILTRYCATKRQYSIQCFAFFAAIFKVLRTSLKKKKKQPGWCKDMCEIGSDTRTSFFVDLEKVFVQIRNEISSTSQGRAVMKEHYQKLVASKSFPQAKKNEPRLVIALDEGHVLHEKNDSQPFHQATVLLHTIKEYSDNNAIWVVFASTMSKVAPGPFASESPQALLPSSRVAVEGHLLFPPFTQLGWDQNVPMLEEVQPEEVAKVEHIIQYGRPLWVSLRPKGEPQTGYSLEQILKLARQKLCGMGEFHPESHHQAFAVLAQRFGLDIAFGHPDAAQYVETLVASHLRVCIKTTENRIWSYSTYPSEPILSCAAASLLHATQSMDNLVDTLDSLERMINHGVVDIGQIGDLVSRFLWLLAKDFLVRKLEVDAENDVDSRSAEDDVDLRSAEDDVDLRSEQVLQDCQLVPVVDFLESVFGPTIWTEAPQARQEFQNAYVNFSHWVSMDFDIRQEEALEQMPIEEWTLCHWERTSAVQCCHNQPLIDKVIPMYFKPQKAGDLAGMSQILISDKVITGSAYASLSDIRRDHPSVAPDYRGLPYIAILVDLGMATPDFKAWVDSSTDRDTCLRIYARGLDARTYPFLKDKGRLEGILQDLYKRQSAPAGRNLKQNLEDQVQFGKSNERRHMNLK